MATSGSIRTTTAFGYVQLSWSLQSQNIANNTSTIAYELKINRTSNISSTTSKNYSITINGVKVASGTVTIGGSGTKSLKSGTATIPHNADGTKSFTYSFSQQIDITWSGNWIGTVSGSGSGTLTSIARATQPTLNITSQNMNSAITINTPRATSTFTHTLRYKFGSATGTIASGVATSQAWTIPISLASQIPNATSGTGTIYCDTYNGTALIGTKSVAFTAKVPTNILPTISAVTISEAVSGIAAKFKGYVQNKSKLSVSITATGSYSSTIKSYKTTIEGQVYSGANITTGTLINSGTVTMTISVTDSRGRTATTTRNITVIEYFAPRILNFQGTRSLADKTENYDGTHLKADVHFEIAPVNNLNDKTFSIQYKLPTASTWSTLTSGSVYAYNDTVISTASFLNVDNSYNIRLVITDYFSTSYAYFDIPTAFTLLDFHRNGKAVSFGKVCEIEEGIEFALPAYFSNGESPEGAIVLGEDVDLDALTKPGFYIIPTAAISATIMGKPFASTTAGATATIQVLKTGTAGQLCQIYIKGSKNICGIWERHYYANSWGGWNRISSGGDRLLWSGSLFMNANQSINLVEPVSEQVNGIVLVFSRYSDGAEKNYNYNHFFVHKSFVKAHPGVGSQFFMSSDGSFGTLASKYLYINDTYISGHANNQLTGTSNGITYANNSFVLRYVFGV